MPLVSGKKRKAELKLKRAIKRGDQQPEQGAKHRKERAHARTAVAHQPSNLQSQFVRLERQFLDETRALAGSIVLRRPILSNVTVLDAPPTLGFQLTVPKRPKWRYQMSKEELDANEQAHFRTWLTQQDAIIEQWQRTLNVPQAVDQTNPAQDRINDDSETGPMPHPPTHFERNIEVWRQFWRVTEISQILLVLLDSRCPPLHLPSPLSAYLHIPTVTSQQSSHSKQSTRSKAPRAILVLTKVDISGPARTASWTSYLNHNYPGVRVVPVEAYAPKSSLAGPSRYEPHLPGDFRERLVHALRDVHEQLLQPPQWVIAPRVGETELERLQRIDRYKPRVKKVIDWDGVLKAKGKLVGKAVGGSAGGHDIGYELEGTEGDEGDDPNISDVEGEQRTGGGAYEWKEPGFLTIGLIGQPNVGKSSLLNAIFGTTRVRASRTPGKTKHFQTLFWTPDVRLVDCPGLVVPSLVPMDTQVLSGVLPISRMAAVPFCVHQLGRLLPLEHILELTHPSESGSSAAAAAVDPTLVEDKRTWRSGQHPPERPKVSSGTLGWTANDIMTSYAKKRGWVTAKAGRPDIHRAGNAILRLIAEGKIPWGFWPPGSSVSGGDGIWLKDGVQQHTRDELEADSEEGNGSTVEIEAGESDEEVVVVEVPEGGSLFRGGNLFGVLSIDD